MADDGGHEDAGGWLQATLGRLTAITAVATSKRGSTRCRYQWRGRLAAAAREAGFRMR